MFRGITFFFLFYITNLRLFFLACQMCVAIGQYVYMTTTTSKGKAPPPPKNKYKSKICSEFFAVLSTYLPDYQPITFDVTT